jgi:predicted regulator of Ras-like GTPase activity (Roadblock/LC7/MglB family)
MSLDAILEGIVREGSGVLGVALMDRDGIPIAEARGSGAASVLPDGDLAAVAVEFGRLLAEIEKASDATGGGPVAETIVALERFSLVFARVEAGLALILALGPDGNLGKARYLIRRNLLGIRQEL